MLVPRGATSSNCGKLLKLQLPTHPRKRDGGQGNDLAYGKNVEDELYSEMDNPQPSSKAKAMSAVQRLDGDGY